MRAVRTNRHTHTDRPYATHWQPGAVSENGPCTPPVPPRARACRFACGVSVLDETPQVSPPLSPWAAWASVAPPPSRTVYHCARNTATHEPTARHHSPALPPSSSAHDRIVPPRRSKHSPSDSAGQPHREECSGSWRGEAVPDHHRVPHASSARLPAAGTAVLYGIHYTGYGIRSTAVLCRSTVGLHNVKSPRRGPTVLRREESSRSSSMTPNCSSAERQPTRAPPTPTHLCGSSLRRHRQCNQQ